MHPSIQSSSPVDSEKISVGTVHMFISYQNPVWKFYRSPDLIRPFHAGKL